MLFTEAVEEVIAAVKRPDLRVRVQREINAAIVFYCFDANFERDLKEQVITLDAQEYTQAFAVSDMERYRKFHYMKRTGTNAFLTKASVNEIAEGCTLLDKYYEVGTAINVSLKHLAASLDVCYYQYPPLLTGANGVNEFWLLDMQPWMIIDRASAAIYKLIGNERDTQIHAASAGEAYRAFLKDQNSKL